MSGDFFEMFPVRLSRRQFLTCCTGAGAGFCLANTLPQKALAAMSVMNMKEAMYYQPLAGGKTRCLMCPNLCERSEGEDGRCRARGNRSGKYYSLVYGRPCVIALDEVEKCPLNHFQLAGKTFSIATAGCNLFCHYCQNWNFSQAGPDEVPQSYDLSSQQVVQKAIANRCSAIAYFYTEPTVYYEYMLDIAVIARQRGLKNIMVTAYQP
jgi:pyruvate formate lyase activating enzyme